MGNLTWGDVLTGRASEDDLAPFGGDQAHKAFALAVGLQLLVDALTPDDGFGALLLVAQPAKRPGSRASASSRTASAFRAIAERGSASSPTAAAEKHGCSGAPDAGQCVPQVRNQTQSFQGGFP